MPASRCCADRRSFAFDERWIYAAAALLATISHVLLEVQPRYHFGYLPIFAICIGSYGSLLRRKENVMTAESDLIIQSDALNQAA